MVIFISEKLKKADSVEMDMSLELNSVFLTMLNMQAARGAVSYPVVVPPSYFRLYVEVAALPVPVGNVSAAIVMAFCPLEFFIPPIQGQGSFPRKPSFMFSPRIIIMATGNSRSLFFKVGDNKPLKKEKK